MYNTPLLLRLELILENIFLISWICSRECHKVITSYLLSVEIFPSFLK